MDISIPQQVKEVIEKLEATGFEAFVVGGCVRDMLLGLEPKDWDVATNAKPEQVVEIFPDSVYENQFGTVGVKVKSAKCKVQNYSSKLKVEEDEGNEEMTEIVEVTTYRIESKYSDKRHPDEVRFAKSLEEDLSRRDFTVNAMALKLETRNVKLETKGNDDSFTFHASRFTTLDPFEGQKDLEKRTIRAVGNPNERFDEDALRMMRAVRFAVTLNGNNQDTRNNNQNNSKFQISNDKKNSKSEFQNPKLWQIEENTFDAIRKNAANLKYISQERIRDELAKIILSPTPAQGIEMLHETGLLQYIIPEIEIGYDVTQSHHHYYGPYNTVYKHLIASLEKCPSEKLEVRLASLLHDVGKPRVKRGEGENATFYNHEYVGAKMAGNILERLRFSKKIIDKTTLLIYNHMFYYNVDEVGEAGVRRVVRKVGLENINDLIDVRIADRLGSGVPKAVPYKLRHFKFMVEKVSRDPISVKQLKINGNDLMKELGIAPGPKIGAILDVLLAEVIEEPALNEKEKLLARAKELNFREVGEVREMAKKRINEEKKKEEQYIKKKYWVE